MLRGDIYRLKPNRQAVGREQQGGRLCIILQNDDLMTLSTVLVAPTSTSAQPSSFRHVVEIDGTETRVLVEQTFAADKDRIGDKVGHLLHNDLIAVQEALQTVLDLD